jgi:predicted kinase
VPRLILLNGAPGTGKSTLAARYAAEHPLTLVLDVDVVRSMLGSWSDAPTEAGLLARHLALAMAQVQLELGRDVVVPQFLGRLDFVRRLDALCREVGAGFVEVALRCPVDDAVRRFQRRAGDPQFRQHADAAELRRMHARLAEVVAARAGTVEIDSVDGDVDGTYSALLSALG